MIRYAVYITATGRITRTGTCVASDIDLQPGAGASVKEIPSGIEVADETHYVDGSSEFASRQTVTATWDKTTIDADGTDEATLSGLPEDCTVYEGDNSIEIDGTVFVFAADAIGDYRILIDEVEYLRTIWEIEAE